MVRSSGKSLSDCIRYGDIVVFLIQAHRPDLQQVVSGSNPDLLRLSPYCAPYAAYAATCAIARATDTAHATCATATTNSITGTDAAHLPLSAPRPLTIKGRAVVSVTLPQPLTRPLHQLIRERRCGHCFL